MLPVKKCHVHKKSKILYPNLFLLSVSGSIVRFSTYWRISLASYEKLYASAYRNVFKKSYFLEGAYV